MWKMPYAHNRRFGFFEAGSGNGCNFCLRGTQSFRNGSRRFLGAMVRSLQDGISGSGPACPGVFRQGEDSETQCGRESLDRIPLQYPLDPIPYVVQGWKDCEDPHGCSAKGRTAAAHPDGVAVGRWAALNQAILKGRLSIPDSVGIRIRNFLIAACGMNHM